MKLGLIGLGKMGFPLAEHLYEDKHEVVVYDVNKELVEKAGALGITARHTLKEMIAELEAPRTIWVMVPAGEVVESVLKDVYPLLDEGDIVIEGGNSFYKDTLRRAEEAKSFGLHYVDIGTSGGVEGARDGACLMVGGEKEIYDQLEPLFKDLAVENGYSYAGRVGSAHFLKMVHNGIEYGMMQAIAEGFEVLDKSDFDFNYEDVAKVWANGSVIRGWLMDLTEKAFADDPKLDGIKGVMNSSGEGKWTVETALELQAAAPVIAMSLFMRYRSQEDDTFHGKVVSALRNQFGGHEVVKK
ncbi:phosphogluconate dehydrogenase (NAD(+)-dependent, decarboxylating) [Bacillus mobilis]|uniref:6-phosphogluconate dehydrogenase (Decarboxylating) n=2 Tax=Bacillus cereus group TaxID=86661 RepID=A0A1C4C704_BACCE|nr:MULTISPECIES: decarboxylating 6-phosphogluconate dehydrogenase [Bacillus cereus group]MCC2461287.1 decarboxylating 6-phosphogluconate dehydrogenase [Bacillus mobilis]MCU5435282.1 decarboxylating 6-phosphogluconate dehydrogenase [Bacillus mobilis]MCU5592712.1 decarboxylating 6-phosphogluconate dehydrogenase [Bacillus mobilis]MCU5739232.1 decarboxylating 6-phosphogluconate dehydrogenase [Bacillus mobilis]MCU9561402.1 decarboxylating 6-phosphogluconate dehydrogenase [Bacillus mobilis]